MKKAERVSAQSRASEFNQHGFCVLRGALSRVQIDAVKSELLSVAEIINPVARSCGIDEWWYRQKIEDRNRAGFLYNAFKHLNSVKKLALSDSVAQILSEVCAVSKPALVDINCRIDSFGEDRYLFDWHQDYWFSVCSPRAVVVWIPLEELLPDVGGLEIISNLHTARKIFKTRPGSGAYHSYADAIELDEDVSDLPVSVVNNMSVGDILIFSFDVLHKSIPVTSRNRSRFTMQFRFADFADREFLLTGYKPGSVNRGKVDYLSEV
jgi:ectoine hydroxylase-related dioxygenase (phytanoyl-CoA dioxygenase family)